MTNDFVFMTLCVCIFFNRQLWSGDYLSQTVATLHKQYKIPSVIVSAACWTGCVLSLLHECVATAGSKWSVRSDKIPNDKTRLRSHLCDVIHLNNSLENWKGLQKFRMFFVHNCVAQSQPPPSAATEDTVVMNGICKDTCVCACICDGTVQLYRKW